MPKVLTSTKKRGPGRPRKKSRVARRKNGELHLSLDSLKIPSYEEVIGEIVKKAGKKPSFPKDLPKGQWTEQALRVLKERYLVRDDKGEVVETAEEMCWRVAWEMASAEALWGKGRREIKELAKKFYMLLITHEFLPNSPTLMNAGTGNMLQYSACFVLPVDDSIEGIFDALKYQALIHKTGGGTGFAFSRLRPNGSMVKSSSGTASGPVSFMRIFDAATNEIKQGGKRRGANMGILRVDHPDILEFIHCKEEGGITNFNISVAITDKFMEAYEKDAQYDLVDPKTRQKVGKLSARRVFDEIVEGAWKTGDPGLVFIDRRNRGTSNPVPALGPIEATNPCIAGDTLISTSSGLISIKELFENKLLVKVLADGRISDVSYQIPLRIIKTGRKKVFRLVTKEGYELRVTADHKVLTERGWIAAKNLLGKDRIFISNRKGAFGKEGSLEEGQILGWLVGDGTIKAASAVLSFFGEEKKELAPKFANMVGKLVDGMQVLNRDYSVSVIDVKGRDEARVQSSRLARYLLENGIEPGTKLKVPGRVFKGNQNMQRGFLQALFTADGHVEGNIQKGASVRLTSISETLLKDVQRLLLNFGIAGKIYSERRGEQMRFLPDGHGGVKQYLCGSYADLVVSRKSLLSFAKEICFLSASKNAKLLSILKRFVRGPYRETFKVRFQKLIKEGIEDVYDLKEPATSSFIANGLVVHNCGEQELYSYDACNLGSIFLTYFVKKRGGKKEVDWEKLKKITRLATRFLDNVIEVNPYPLPQIRRTVWGIRRIGLGVGGWADMLVELGIPYDSKAALSLGKKVMKTIQEEAVAMSEELAGERGPFPLWPASIYAKGKPRRNSTVTTIAPTGTISIIAGASSGIEPLFAIAYQHIVRDKHLDRTLTFVNPRFEEVAKSRGFWSEEVKKKVAGHGVIREIEEIPEDVREVFGTAHEIHYDWHIKMQAVFQKYTENAVSKTINMENKVTAQNVADAYLLAWKTDCKGITVFRDGSKDAQVLNLGVKDGETKVSDSEPTLTRPFKVTGATYRLDTPVGVAFVTINENENGEPLELFINVGKAGSDVAAMAEALGRAISASLRFRGGLSPRKRAEELANQLAGIGGRRSVGFGAGRIRSLPDAIAAALSSHLGFKINGNGNNIVALHSNKEAGAKSDLAGAVMPAQAPGVNRVPRLNRGDDHTTASAESNPAPDELVTLNHNNPGNNPGSDENLSVADVTGDICPSCGLSALVYEEGCSKCYACGHSEC